MTIHGVAPWGVSAPVEVEDDRIIAYFRPFSPSVAEWMTLA
jgi:hypothetical protein